MPAEPLSLDKLDPVEAWKPWEPANKKLGLKWAGHLYRRAGFGATRDELHRAANESPAAVIDRFFAIEPDRRAKDSELAQQGIEIAAANNARELRAWWLDRMLHGGFPLREKLTLFWHNHFATSINKVQSAALMHRQNELMRQHALGTFGPMLQQMSKDPAMLIWLDSNSNVKGKPNENYAREVMELVRLGVGNYTEKDIREAARAFTGWHTDGNRVHVQRPICTTRASKTVLGQTGKWDGGDVVRICPRAAGRAPASSSASCIATSSARRCSRRTHSSQPLADAYRKSDYDTAALVRTMLSSRHFFSEHAYRQRIKSPVEYVARAFEPSCEQERVEPGALVGQLELLGQQLFAPPNVKGWEGGKAWLNTATLLVRHNLAVHDRDGRRRAESASISTRRAASPSPSGRQTWPGEKADFQNRTPCIVLRRLPAGRRANQRSVCSPEDVPDRRRTGRVRARPSGPRDDPRAVDDTGVSISLNAACGLRAFRRKAASGMTVERPMLTRRRFLTQTLKGTSLLSIGTVVPQLHRRHRPRRHAGQGQDPRRARNDRRQRRPEHRHPVHRRPVPQGSHDAADAKDQVIKVDDDDRPAPRLSGVSATLAAGPARRRAGRRLPEPRPLALRVDGRVAPRRPHTQAEDRLDGPQPRSSCKHRPAACPACRSARKAAAGPARRADQRRQPEPQATA